MYSNTKDGAGWLSFREEDSQEHSHEANSQEHSLQHSPNSTPLKVKMWISWLSQSILYSHTWEWCWSCHWTLRKSVFPQMSTYVFDLWTTFISLAVISRSPTNIYLKLKVIKTLSTLERSIIIHKKTMAHGAQSTEQICRWSCVQSLIFSHSLASWKRTFSLLLYTLLPINPLHVMY